jgi:foldase protein PrsA
MKLIKALCVLGLATAGLCMLSACTDTGSNGKGTSGADGLTGGVAATVNGVEIAEDDVTVYIQEYRTSYGMTDEDSWGEYLADSGTTPEAFREDTIGTFIEDELTRQAMAEKGIEVDTAEVDERINAMRVNYESEEAWNQALQGAGWTEEAYREEIGLRLQLMRLIEEVAPAEEPAEEDVLNYIQMYMSMFDGAKRSSHILFESADEKTAQEALDKINAGELDFAEAAKQHSKDGSAENGGDVGWDKLSQFVTAYQEALDELELDQVSGLVTSEYGIHVIKCTDLFTAPEEVTDPNQVPVEYADTIRNMIRGWNQEEAYNEWLEKYREAADIVINPMPAKVPYNLNIDKYIIWDDEGDEDAEDEEAEYEDLMDEEADDGDGAQDAETGEGDTEGDEAQAPPAAS